MAGSTFPPPPEFYKLHGERDDIMPPAPVDGEITTFGVTAHSAVAMPLLPGARTDEWSGTSAAGERQQLFAPAVLPTSLK
jgi:hypothetical protein